jgi:transglutaminase-like putative cysteine protease
MIFTKILIPTFFFLSIFADAQVKITDEEKQTADSLRITFKDAPLVINSSAVRFEFIKNNNKLNAVQSIKNNYTSLRLNHTAHVAYYYDDYSNVKINSIRNHKKKIEYNQPVMGDVMVDEIFYHDQKFCGLELYFESLGETKEIDVTKQYNDVKYLTSFFLGELYPILFRKVTVVIPAWLKIEIKEYHFENFSVSKNSIPQENGNTEITYEINSLEGMEEEAFSKGGAFYYPSILFMIKGFETNGQETRIIESKDDLYSWYYSLIDTTDKNSEYVKNFTHTLIAGCNTLEDKIRTIYYWVQDNIRYIAFEKGLAGYKPESAEKVLQNKYGDCKGMANLLKAMLSAIGVDARLTWLGTNNVLYNYDTPTLSSDNHMICTVFMNDKRIFLDATQKYSPLYDVSERIQGRQVLIENGDSYIFDSIPVMDYNRNILAEEIEVYIHNKNLAGEVCYSINGEKRAAFLSMYHTLETGKRNEEIRKFLKGKSNVIYKDILFKNYDDRDTTLQITAKLEIENEVSEFNNELYIALFPMEELMYFEMDSKRKTDIYFNEKIARTTHMIMEVPDGWHVKYLPEDFKLENEYYQFSIQCENKKGQIHIARKILIPKGFIPLQMKEDWNAFQKKVKHYNKEQIILSKN